MTRTFITGALGTVIAAVAFAPAATAGNQTFATKLTIEAGEIGLSGEVTSVDEDCFNERKVILYKRKGKKPRPSKDKKVGTAVAQPNGESALWQIEVDKAGKYYAYVKKQDECRAGRSKVVKFTP